MSAADIQFISCPNCNGNGLTADGSLSCPSCSGSGGWLQTPEGTKLQFQGISHVRSRPQPGYTGSLYSAVALCAGIGLLLSLILLLREVWPDYLPRLFWQGTPASLGFALSGVLWIIALTLKYQISRSEHSFYDLVERLARHPAGEVINLADYANRRVIGLLNLAAGYARSRQAAQVEDADIFQALMAHPRIQLIATRLEINPADLLQGAPSPSSGSGYLPVSPGALRRLTYAVLETLNHKYPYLDIEDVLLSYLDGALVENQPYQAFLTELRLSQANLAAVIRWYAEEEERNRLWTLWHDRGRARPKTYMNRGWTALPTPFLDSFGRDLTVAASLGEVSNAEIHAKELESALETLGSETTRNVLFVGEPGSGANELLNAVATRVLEGRVPESLQDKRLVELDLPRLLTAEGGAEENLQRALDEIEKAGNVILAIPEVQAVADATAAGLDGAGVLANALKNRVVQLISTATYADYHRYVEQNSLLKSELHVIELHPLAPEEILRALEAATHHLEAKMAVVITYPALEEAVKLAERYIPEPAPPQNAIQLLEKAATLAVGTDKWVRRTTVQKAVESLTHVPVSTASGGDAQKLLNLEQILHQRVIGQETAVRAVAEAMRRARAGLTNGKRPLGSFLFVGPTGVGKTELAKALCESYFGPESQMIRFDMSEFQEPRSIYTLIGPPPESGESTEGGALTQAVREHPFSLILFDELEKAHPDVLNLFLQILDDGRVTENTGRTVRLHTTIIIATSNARSTDIGTLLGSTSNVEALQPQILRLLEENFRPEFLNRFDAVIPFKPLTQAELAQIAGLMVAEEARKAREQDITLSVTPAALTKLIQAGYDQHYGARPLRRTIEQKVEGILAEALLSGRVKAGDTLQIDEGMVH